MTAPAGSGAATPPRTMTEVINKFINDEDYSLDEAEAFADLLPAAREYDAATARLRFALALARDQILAHNASGKHVTEPDVLATIEAAFGGSAAGRATPGGGE